VTTVSFFISISVKHVSNLTSHHKEIIFSLRFLTIDFNLSVPICGLASYAISFGAQALMSSSKIYFVLGSFTHVYSFPSENVPAQPSPNCTFEFTFNFPVCKNFSTSWARVSTSTHLSIKSGFSHAVASISAANSPLGQLPTTTGRCNTKLGSTDFIS
jgi:hypothetical protein